MAGDVAPVSVTTLTAAFVPPHWHATSAIKGARSAMATSRDKPKVATPLLLGVDGHAFSVPQEHPLSRDAVARPA